MRKDMTQHLLKTNNDFKVGYEAGVAKGRRLERRALRRFTGKLSDDDFMSVGGIRKFASRTKPAKRKE